MLFMTGVHSAIVGPLKYSMLSDHLREDELLAGNSLMAGATYASVLAGLVLGGLVLEFDRSGYTISVIFFICAMTGFITSFFILPNKPSAPDLKLNHNFITEAVKIVKYVRNSRSVILSILGLSWFLLIAAIFMSQLPTFSKSIGGDNEVYTLFLVIFSLGVAGGSLLCNKLLRGQVSAKFTPVVSLLISICIYSLVFTSPENADTNNLVGAYEFIQNTSNWPMIISMFGIAIAGGIYIVPLYTIMQTKAEESWRSRVVAARNVINSLFITTGMVISAILLALYLDVFELFILIASANLIVTAYSCKVLPELPNRAKTKIKAIKGKFVWVM